MSIERYMTTPVTILRPVAVEDRYGDTRPDWAAATSTTTTGWAPQVSADEHHQGRDAYETGVQLFLRATETVDAGDRVQIGDVVFDIEGPPVVARTPRGAHHIEAQLKAVEG